MKQDNLIPTPPPNVFDLQQGALSKQQCNPLLQPLSQAVLCSTGLMVCIASLLYYFGWPTFLKLRLPKSPVPKSAFILNSCYSRAWRAN